jgi:hypothetical protein
MQAYMRFEDLTTVKMSTVVFRVVTPPPSALTHYDPPLTRPHSVTTHKTGKDNLSIARCVRFFAHFWEEKESYTEYLFFHNANVNIWCSRGVYKMQMFVLLIVMLCVLVRRYQCFGETYLLNFQGFNTEPLCVSEVL